MSEHTPNLSLPLLMPSQAQKHVTHNEALCMLDMLCQLSAKDVHVDNAPITPAQGDVYLLGSAPTGDWNGQAHAIAAYDGVGWRFVTPRTGWRAFVESSAAALCILTARTGSRWRPPVAVAAVVTVVAHLTAKWLHWASARQPTLPRRFWLN